MADREPLPHPRLGGGGALSPEPIDLLIGADYLYPMSEGLPIVEGGEVAVRGDTIVYAGPKKGEGAWNPARRIHGRNRAVLPGFVNCHTHVASAVFRSQTDDFDARYAIYNVVFRMENAIGPDEWHHLALLGCADMLKSGVTTINDIWYCPDRLAEAVEQTGLRATLSEKLFDVHLEDLYQGNYTRYVELGQQRLRSSVDFVRAWHGKADGRILGRISPHATDTCSTELLRDARAEATRLGVGTHTHAAQSDIETGYIERAHGCGPLEYLRDIGLLADDVVAAHLIFATDADLEAMRETGAAYAHSPITYPRGGFYPRFASIQQTGVRIGFATDWMQNDPFEGMRNALNAVRLQANNADALLCPQALRYSTLGGAEALGLGDRIGSLEPGKKADLIAIDLDQTHLQPFYGAYASLVFYARASDVRTSIVDGQVVVEDGHLLSADEPGILEEMKQRRPSWRHQLAELGSRNIASPCC